MPGCCLNIVSSPTDYEIHIPGEVFHERHILIESDLQSLEFVIEEAEDRVKLLPYDALTVRFVTQVCHNCLGPAPEMYIK